jgi:hypothetical protein
MKTIFYALTLQILLLVSAGAAAEDVRYYDFEIIIFEAMDQESKISEVWESNLTIEPPETFVTLGQPFPGPMPKEYNPKYTFKFLPKSDYRLNQEAKLLENNDDYRILMHIAWRQPGMSEATTLPIHLHKEFIITQEVNSTPPLADPDMPAVNLPVPTRTTTQKRAVLDGYLKIILSRYLHADFNLVLNTGLPLTPEASPPITTGFQTGTETGTEIVNDPVIISYKLQETRKMRSKEIHYIDHPVIGVVMLAWPFKPDSQ